MRDSKDKEGITTEISEKKQMEEAIIKENTQKCHQTEKTCPFLKNPLKNHFGPLGKGPATEMVLNGSYITPPCENQQTKQFLQVCSLKNKEHVKTDLKRTKEQYVESWKKIKEKTASRQLHYGHFKA